MITQGLLGPCFWKPKNEAFNTYRKLAKVIQNEKGHNVVSIRSDHGGEFQNESFENFCEENWIHNNFLCNPTPQGHLIEDSKKWVRDVGEGLRVLMSLRVDFGPMD